jgi:hypothetical protein
VTTSSIEAATADRQSLSKLATAMFRVITSSRVADRPDRVEPRAVKKRPKKHTLLTVPRAEARARLYAASTPP